MILSNDFGVANGIPAFVLNMSRDFGVASRVRKVSGALLLIATLALFHPAHMSAQARPTADLVIRNARVVVGDGRVISSADIGIRGGIITSIDPAGARAAGAGSPGSDSSGTRLIDAAGRTVIPGLIDAHVHADGWTLPVFLKYGVTSVRDLHSDGPFIFPLAKDDSPAHPRIVTSGPLIDGVGSFWKNAVQVASLGEARAAVRRLVDQGAAVIKVYTRLDPALIAAVASEARARGVPVAAHLGFATAAQAADAGVTSIEHLSGIADAASDEPRRLLAAHQDFLGGWTAFELEWQRIPFARLESVAKQLVARGIVIVPTLALHEAFARMADADLMKDPALSEVPAAILRDAWNPVDIMGRAKWTVATLAAFKQTLPILRRFVGMYAHLGGRIAAGTDTRQQFVVPGVSLHREMELCVASGLTPAQALKTATVEAAALLGIQDRVGLVAVGKTADLVVLDADPLGDIRNTRRIWMVVKGGTAIR